MTAKIIEQGPCWTIYQDDEPGPGIPYRPQQHRDGNKNYGFVNLKAHFEFIPQIAEAKDKPALIKLLEVINGKSSPLMSLGCTNGLFTADDPQPNGPTHYWGSYINITYASAVKAQVQDNLFLLAKKLLDVLQVDPTQWIMVEIGIEKMPNFFGASDCYDILLRLNGYGRDPNEAQKVWSAAYERLADRLPKIFDDLT